MMFLFLIEVRIFHERDVVGVLQKPKHGCHQHSREESQHNERNVEHGAGPAFDRRLGNEAPNAEKHDADERRSDDAPQGPGTGWEVGNANGGMPEKGGDDEKKREDQFEHGARRGDGGPRRAPVPADNRFLR